MKYVFSLDLKVDWLKMSNASLVVDEIDDHSTGKWTERQYLYDFKKFSGPPYWKIPDPPKIGEKYPYYKLEHPEFRHISYHIYSSENNL